MGECLLPPVHRRGFLGVRKMAAKAVAAMHRARTRRDQQRAPVVLVQNAFRRACGDITDGVMAETGHFAEFGGLWQYLQQQGGGRAAAAHPRDETSWHAKRESAVGAR